MDKLAESEEETEKALASIHTQRNDLAALCHDVLINMAKKESTTIDTDFLEQQLEYYQLGPNDHDAVELIRQLRNPDKPPQTRKLLSALALIGWCQQSTIEENETKRFVQRAAYLMQRGGYNLFEPIDKVLAQEDSQVVWQEVGLFTQEQARSTDTANNGLAFALYLLMTRSSHPEAQKMALSVQHYFMASSAPPAAYASSTDSTSDKTQRHTVSFSLPDQANASLHGTLARKGLSTRWSHVLSIVTGWVFVLTILKGLSWLLWYRRQAEVELDNSHIAIREQTTMFGKEISLSYQLWPLERCQMAAFERKMASWPQVVTLALVGIGMLWGSWHMANGLIAGDRTALWLGGTWLIAGVLVDISVFMLRPLRRGTTGFVLRIADRTWHLRHVQEEAVQGWIEQFSKTAKP